MTELPSLAEEFIIQLDVTMADRLGRPQPPAYSWNGGLVRHMLKNDPAMGDLKHVEVDGPGRAYLFFFMTDMDIAASPKRRHWLCVPTLQTCSQNGSGDPHISTQFPYC